MNSTKLSTLLSRMDRFQTIANVEEELKVRDLDDAIRNLRRKIQPIWADKKSTIRVFDEVLEYPIAIDHDAIHYVDTSTLSNNDFQSSNSLTAPANFRFTSLKEFYEDPNNRNDMAEIWNNGTRYLGIRYEDFNFGNATVDTASVIGNYSTSGDAGTPVIDQVFFKVGNSSVKVPVIQSTNIATVNITPSSPYDSEYKRKYFFIYVYMPSAPLSVELRFGNDSSDYMATVVTNQFSGIAFSANDWNLLAFDLNAPGSTVGTISQNVFNYAAVILNGAPSGNYYIGQSYLREWNLMDYWYYTTYNIKTVNSSVPNQEYFYDDTDNYSLDSELVGDKEWADVIMYDAILLGLIDKENSVVRPDIEKRRDEAFQKLMDNYPSEKPLISNSKYEFDTDYGSQYNQPRNW